MSERIEKHAEMLSNRVRKNLKRLGRWIKKENIHCYRLYDRDIPEIPLVLDWYQGHLHVAEFQKQEVSEEFCGKEWMLKVLEPTIEYLNVPNEKVFHKIRDRQRGQGQYQAKGSEYNRIQVKESGHTFLVNLSDYLDTGLFLDHRRTRAMVAAESKGKSVLNLYCYTGSFSVYAAAAGAATTMGIDLSGTYLDWARANLDLNQLDKNRNRLVRGDVMEELVELRGSGEKFDLVVVDPPTFSNSKKLKGVFDIQRDHQALLQAVHLLLAKDASVYFSTNHRRFKLDAEIEEQYQVENISAKTLPFDYRDQKIHRCWRLHAK